jgi:hypothetical protein
MTTSETRKTVDERTDLQEACDRAGAKLYTELIQKFPKGTFGGFGISLPADGNSPSIFILLRNKSELRSIPLIYESFEVKVIISDDDYRFEVVSETEDTQPV